MNYLIIWKKNLDDILIFRELKEPKITSYVFSGKFISSKEFKSPVEFKSPEDCITKIATGTPADGCLIEMEPTGVYVYTTLPHNNPTGGYKRLTHTKKNKKSKKTRRTKKNGKK